MTTGVGKGNLLHPRMRERELDVEEGYGNLVSLLISLSQKDNCIGRSVYS